MPMPPTLLAPLLRPEFQLPSALARSRTVLALRVVTMSLSPPVATRLLSPAFALSPMDLPRQSLPLQSVASTEHAPDLEYHHVLPLGGRLHLVSRV